MDLGTRLDRIMATLTHLAPFRWTLNYLRPFSETRTDLEPVSRSSSELGSMAVRFRTEFPPATSRVRGGIHPGSHQWKIRNISRSSPLPPSPPHTRRPTSPITPKAHTLTTAGSHHHHRPTPRTRQAHTSTHGRFSSVDGSTKAR